MSYKKTLLYKSIKKRLTPNQELWSVVKPSLKIVIETPNTETWYFIDNENLGSAFDWESSPQGHKFWECVEKICRGVK